MYRLKPSSRSVSRRQKVDGFVDPTGDPTGLKCLIGDRSFRGMTLHEWGRDEERLLGVSKRALVLFDVNFGLETGDESDEAGLGPAGRALRDTNDHIVGLLTTKTAAGHEDEAADAWAPRVDVERADLVVVNKNLLVDPSSTDDIARAVGQIGSALRHPRWSASRNDHGSLQLASARLRKHSASIRRPRSRTWCSWPRTTAASGK